MKSIEAAGLSSDPDKSRVDSGHEEAADVDF